MYERRGVTRALLVTIPFIASFTANAAGRDLINTLYHADFVQYEDEEEEQFSLDGELGVIVSSGNTNATSIKAGMKAEHETQYFATQYFAEFLYKQTEIAVDDGYEDQVTAQRLYTYAQSDYKLNASDRRLFLYGDYEDNRFNGYDYQASVAVGWSQLTWRDEQSEFRYSIGPGYTLAKLESGESADNVDGVIIRASAEYKYKWPSGAKIRQFISTEAGDENTKSRSETSLSANLFDALAMKVSFILNHNTRATNDNVALSTETSVALVYRFF